MLPLFFSALFAFPNQSAQCSPERNPIYADILTHFHQSPDILEALQLDGVSFLFSGLGSESGKPDRGEKTDRELDSTSIMTILAHWIEQNRYFHKLELKECFFSISGWKLLSARMSRISRLTDVSITGCGISSVILKILLKGLRRNPISSLDLGYNQLRSEGSKLLVRGLLQKLSEKSKPPNDFYQSSPKQSSGCDEIDIANRISQMNTSDIPRKTSRMDSYRAVRNKLFPKASLVEPIVQDDPLESDARRFFAPGKSLESSSCQERESVQNSTEYSGPWVARIHTLAGENEEQSFLHQTSITCSKLEVQNPVPIPSGCPALGLNLTELLLPVNDIGDHGAVLIAQLLRSAAVPQLRSLDLRCKFLLVYYKH